jgi:transaldolase/glucose-6-phosphate isomerase
VAKQLRDTQKQGQSIWYDNVSRGLLTSGEMAALVESGITGLTSNPTIFEKAIAGSTDYDDALLTLVADRKSASDIFESLATQDIRDAADLMRSIYEQVDGADGFASFEVSPHLAHDTEGTISEGRRLFALLDRPNVMIKVPATPEGVPAVRQLISEGINVNVTLIFSLEAYDQVREAYIGGLEELAASGGDVSRVASVASFFVSRVDSAVDALLDERSRAGSEDLEDLVSKAAIANAKLAYRDFQNVFGNDRFAALRARGAKVQRPLWASTSTKNPALSDVLYVESLIGRDTVNTVPEATLTAFLEHGNAAETLEQDLGDAEQTIESLRDAGVSMEQVTAKLLADGVKSFADSFDKLIENIEEKTSRLLASQHAHPTTELGGYLSEVEATLEDLEKRDVVGRIWRRDHTVWKPEPEEITNRLGWLTVTDAMCEHVEELDAFSKEVRDAGFRHVVLLGMGGSSLGPEVLRQTFGSIDGYPELFVLDSTVPGWVQSVTDAIDPAHTLFLVSSKSGSTVEPNTFYRYFRSLVDSAVGQERAGQNFVAITDPGSSLETLGHEHGFRRVFKNPPDIGGRYSVQSYFGLVPAALMGVDITLLLDRVDSMREGCASFVPVHDNPGAWLGTIIGTLSLKDATS